MDWAHNRRPVETNELDKNYPLRTILSELSSQKPETYLMKNLSLAIVVLLAVSLSGQSSATGKLVVNGKSVDITQAYAYVEMTVEGAKKTENVVVLLCDAPVPNAAVQDGYERNKLIDADKLHCVEVMVNSGKKALHYSVQHKLFGAMMNPGGDDEEHLVDVKTLDSKMIAGRASTKVPQKSWTNDMPYSYDITFSAPIAPAEPGSRD